ncbi:hypothetical protein EON64_14510, partial [archaeon]
MAKKATEKLLPVLPTPRGDEFNFATTQTDFILYENLKLLDQMVPSPYDRLKTIKPFVLDNSIRESTVAQIRGHVKEDKYSILRAVEEVGFENIIVASFSELPQVEDEWLGELNEQGMMKPSFFCFSELFDRLDDGLPSADCPLGIFKMLKYNLQNVIIEMDVDHKMWESDKLGEVPAAAGNSKWTFQQHCELLRQRIETVKNEISPSSIVFVNFRDAAAAYARSDEGARRLITLVCYLARLPPTLRPRGLLFEEPMG